MEDLVAMTEVAYELLYSAVRFGIAVNVLRSDEMK